MRFLEISDTKSPACRRRILSHEIARWLIAELLERLFKTALALFYATLDEASPFFCLAVLSGSFLGRKL
jgi:hypothetical protein